MYIAAVVTTSACFYLLSSLCDATSRQFILAGQNRQFKSFGTVKKVRVMSLTQCAVECLNMGSQCGSFSFSQTKLCTINAMRMQAQHVQQSQQLFDVESGTLMYGCMSGDIAQHGNVAVRETDNYSYLLSLKPASWNEALALCPQFGNSFYLANMDNADELDSLRLWFNDVANRDYIWVSGTDENHESCWVWAAPVITKLTDNSMWGNNEPDKGSEENCMSIYDHPNWNLADADCNRVKYYLCKRAVNREFNSIPTAEQAQSRDIC